MSFSRPGAVDLSALAGRSAAPVAGGAGGGTYAVDATEQNFQQLAIEASLQHIVVLSLWSSRSPQSVQFNELLTRTVDAYEGRLSLVRVDVDANPQIAAALGAQAVPLVVALIQGQPAPLFQSTVGEDELQATFDQLVQIAVQNGMAGRAQPVAAAGDEVADDPRFAAADAALAANDIEAAVAEYEKLAGQFPADVEVKERLAGVRLIQRTHTADLNAARAAAAADPADLDAQLLVADLDVNGGHVDDALGRLLDLIRDTAGDERDRVRERLLELFTVVGTADPRVAAARRALATALF